MKKSFVFIAGLVFFVSGPNSKRAGCWKSWRRCWLWLAPLLLLSGLVRPDIQILHIDAPDIELLFGVPTVRYVFKVKFSIVNESGYRFVISDSAGGLYSNRSSGDWSKLIQPYINPPVTYSQPESNPSTKNFILGSDVQLLTKYADTSAHTLVGEFAIDINADNLKKEMSRDPKFTFSFWLVGQALDNTFNAVGNTFEEEVKPSVKVAPVVQVSNLKDIVIPDKDPVGGYYLGITDFCVYVSEAPREYTIKFTDQNTGGGDYFILKNSSSNSGSTLRYEMAFADSRADITYGGANYYEKATSLNNSRPYTGDANPTCLGGANHSGAVGVRVSKQNLDSAQDGFYTDTITVVVSPQ